MTEVFRPQRGGMFIGVEQQKIPLAPLGAAWKPDNPGMPPRWGFFIFRLFAIDMPLLTELRATRNVASVQPLLAAIRTASLTSGRHAPEN
jgi:hypothetical protein